MVGEYTQLDPEVASFRCREDDILDCPGDQRSFFNGSDPTYVGWYVEAGWFLTGKSRGYKEGEFVGIKVKNPVLGGGKGGGFVRGAWQIAGRYDVIELSDKATTFGVPDVADPITYCLHVPSAATRKRAHKLRHADVDVTLLEPDEPPPVPTAALPGGGRWAVS